ncbi:AHH domain-containing protein, partial [Pyxidicoccus sp. 3LG]
IVPIQNHKGPHPEAYHKRIYKALTDATHGCRSVAACQKAMKASLRDLADQIATPGTELHRLVTQGAAR